MVALVGTVTLLVGMADLGPCRGAVVGAGGVVVRVSRVGCTETDVKTGGAAGVPVALVTCGPEGGGVSRFRPAALLDRFEDLPGLAGRFLG